MICLVPSLNHDLVSVVDVYTLGLRFAYALTAQVIPAIVLGLILVHGDVVHASIYVCYLEVVGIEVDFRGRGRG